jgi:hypothetical protein
MLAADGGFGHEDGFVEVQLSLEAGGGRCGGVVE